MDLHSPIASAQYLRVAIVCPAILIVAATVTKSCGEPATAAPRTSWIEPGAEVEKIASDLKFTEGPVWLADQKKLIFSDIPNSKLMQWSESAGLSVFRTSEKANGNILDLQGRLVSCQHQARNLVRTEPDGSLTVIADKFDGKRLNSPNDLAVHANGSIWFTDPGWGLFGQGVEPELPGHWVYKLDPKTKKTEVLIKDLAMPNGINFSPDFSRLYVADTGGHPKHPDANFRRWPNSICCYAITADGQLGKKLFQIDEGSDGMVVDEKGNVYTTHKGHVNIFSPEGKSLQRIAIPENPANVCFGGDDFKTLFITARTSVYRVRMVNAGARTP